MARVQSLQDGEFGRTAEDAPESVYRQDEELWGQRVPLA
jgi:hypothetical protein